MYGAHASCRRIVAIDFGQFLVSESLLPHRRFSGFLERQERYGVINPLKIGISTAMHCICPLSARSLVGWS